MRIGYICDMQIEYSFIIPVYNRPEETQELLESLVALKTNLEFEVVIIEDGSNISSEDVVNAFRQKLNLSYYFKANSGPGDSRNYGMQRANGNYFIILDSDCILPENYLNEVDKSLKMDYVDCFGGPDNAHKTFSNIQKAINFVMTSIITTGGIRGNKQGIDKFQPRSFNMGLSKKAFLNSKGFGRIHPGEDPDLSIRLWNLGYKTKLITEAFVFHKRRISWHKFYKQVHKFGLVRPILNKWHPKTKRFTYWFPSLFCMGLLLAMALSFFGLNWPLLAYSGYFLLVFLMAVVNTKSIVIAFLAVWAICIQFFGYGLGFLKSTLALQIFKKKEQEAFPNLFFKQA